MRGGWKRMVGKNLRGIGKIILEVGGGEGGGGAALVDDLNAHYIPLYGPNYNNCTVLCTLNWWNIHKTLLVWGEKNYGTDKNSIRFPMR